MSDNSSEDRHIADKHAQNKRFTVLTEKALDIVAVLDANAVVMYESPSLERVLGWLPQEIVGRSALELIHPDDRHIVEKLYADNISVPHAIVSTEYRCLHRDGTWRILESIATNLLHDPTVSGVLVNSRDITERKQAEMKVAKRASQQKAIAELGQRALAGLALHDLMQEATERLASEFDVQYCVILQFQPMNDKALLVACHGCDPQLVGNIFVPVTSQTITGHTILFNEPIIVSDLTLDKRFSYTGILNEFEVVSGISVVIPGIKGPWGTLGAYSCNPRTFAEDDINIFLSMANLLAEAIRRQGVEDNLRELRDEKAAVLNSIGDGVHGIDLNGQIVFENPASADMLGYSLGELVGKDSHTMLHHTGKDGQPYDEEKCPVHATLRDAKPRRIHDEIYWRKDGTSFPVDLTITPVMSPAGTVVGGTVVFTDITERKKNEEALQASEARFSQAFEHAAIGMAIVALDGSWIKINQAVSELLGFTREQLYTMTFQDITHPEDLDADLENVNRLLAGEIQYYHMEKRYRHNKGHTIWTLLAVSLVRDQDNQPLHFISQIQDITERKLAEERLIHDALHDSLTGLANRALLSDHIELAFKRFGQNEHQPFALILIDLDRFKNINDTLGHPVGDLVLLEMARRFKQSVTPLDTVSRLGGDEFAILLEGISGDNSPTHVADRLLNAALAPVVINNHVVDLTASIGIVMVTPQHRTTTEIIRDADIALYRAKAAGRGNYQVFDQNMHVHIRERMQLEADLKQAIKRGQLELYLQPIVTLSTGRIGSFEALLRWKHPERGMVPPDVFIPIAEETGIISNVSQWVTREVCRILKTWPDGNPPPISINASPAEIIRPRRASQYPATAADLVDDFDEIILRILREENVSPDLVRIEITEGVLISEPAYVSKVLGKLVEKGFKLLLDDFGTGYSSFSYLQDLPISQVKLDRVFTAKLGRESRSRELMHGLITLAQTIGLEVVAEGVEDQEQLSLLREAGCDCIQGYLISRPVPVAEAQALYFSKQTW